MLQNLNQFLAQAVYWIPALVIAFTFHEYAHGKVADMLGDPTPRNHGRLTLNPVSHVDPVGLLMLILVRFGWAKPVPVNPLHFRGDRRKGMLLVSLAGPGANFVIALFAGIGRAVSIIMLVQGNQIAHHFYTFFEYLLMYNVFLGVFNLLPVPPLDGSKILFNILPPRYSSFMFQLEQYGFLILMLLLITGAHRFFLIPVANGIMMFITNVAAMLVAPFL